MNKLDSDFDVVAHGYPWVAIDELMDGKTKVRCSIPNPATGLTLTMESVPDQFFDEVVIKHRNLIEAEWPNRREWFCEGGKDHGRSQRWYTLDRINYTVKFNG